MTSFEGDLKDFAQAASTLGLTRAEVILMPFSFEKDEAKGNSNCTHTPGNCTRTTLGIIFYLLLILLTSRCQFE